MFRNLLAYVHSLKLLALLRFEKVNIVKAAWHFSCPAVVSVTENPPSFDPTFCFCPSLSRHEFDVEEYCVTEFCFWFTSFHTSCEVAYCS